MSSLGFYFGPKTVNVVLTKGKVILSSSSMPLAEPEAELEEKVPEEVKIVAFFKDELRRLKIQEKEAAVSLSGKDLIIRTFDMPILPQAELASAVNFEVKKYIPFKVEDLVSDFQVKTDKASRKNIILFIGIKKETLNKNLSILNQLNIKTATIEYSGFNLMRLLALGGVGSSGVVGVICTDTQERDEANFLVLEDGFPLFSRDIPLTVEGPAQFVEPGQPQAQQGAVTDKLKNELRLSLDFYYRKFPAKKIKHLCLLSNRESASDLEAFIRELGLEPKFLDMGKYIGKQAIFSLSLIKGYACSLYKTIKTGIKLKLLEQRLKAPSPVLVKEKAFKPEEALYSLRSIRISPQIVIIGVVACFVTFAYGLYRKLPVQQQLADVIRARPKVETQIKTNVDYKELENIDSDFKKKIAVMDNLVRNQLYATEPLNVVPRAIPAGVWLSRFTLRKDKDKAELTLEGNAFLGDSKKEFELVDKFLSKLKDDPVLIKYFKEMDITSLRSAKVGEDTMTSFVISCKNYITTKKR